MKVGELNKRLYSQWYSCLDAVYAMFPYLQGREGCLLDPTRQYYAMRYLRFWNAQSIQYHRLNSGRGKVYNYYASLARIPALPFTFEASGRSRAVEEWKKNYLSLIKGYDFLIDIDVKSDETLEWGVASAETLRSLLNSCSCPYRMRFSGRGFHFIIPYEALPPSNNFLEYMKFYDLFLKRLKAEVSCMIDSGIADTRRVCKVPYSLAFYSSGDVRVCFPLSSKELGSFSAELAAPGRWLENRKLFKREDILYNKMGSAEKVLEVLEV